MSSTNKTVTIELSQYVGTDKPTYLVDYNGDMLKIDNAIAADRDSIQTAQAKANEADSKADTNAGAISDLNDQINTPATGLAAVVNQHSGHLNTIDSLIGNGEPTTQDKTLIGAINELAAEIPGGSVSAANVSYDNATSRLTADEVQEAIDELAQKSANAQGVIDELTLNDINTGISIPAATMYTIPSDGYIECSVQVGSGSTGVNIYGSSATTDTDTHTSVFISGQYSTSSVFVRKGMKAYTNADGTNATCKFYAIS